MPPLAERLNLITPSPTLALDAKAKALKAAGRDVINFGIGEPDFETPEHIKEAAIKAVKDGHTRYTPADGSLDLKEAVCRKFKRDNGLDYTPSQIVVSNGGKHSLYNAVLALFQPGDEVIVPSPYWVSYPPQIRLAGAAPVVAKTLAKDDYLLTPELLKAALSPKTRGIILNSPSNPTGSVYDEAALRALGEVLLKRDDVWIISDDIYEKMLFDGRRFSNLPMLMPELRERCVIAHGASKTYAMTGWRIGFLAAPEKVARAAAKVQGHSTSNPCSISQRAALAALDGPQDAVETMRQSFQRRRDLVLKLLADIPGVECPRPGGAFYVFPDFSCYYGQSFEGRLIGGSDDLADFLLDRAEAAIVPGSGFGEDKAMRLSYAISDEEITRGLTRVKAALTLLK